MTATWSRPQLAHRGEPGNGRWVVRQVWQYPHPGEQSSASLLARIRYFPGATDSQNVSASMGSQSRSNTLLAALSGSRRVTAAKLPECGRTPRVVWIQLAFMFWNQIPALGLVHWPIHSLASASRSSSESAS